MSTITSVAAGPSYQPPRTPQATQPQPPDLTRTARTIARTDNDGDNDGSKAVDIKA